MNGDIMGPSPRYNSGAAPGSYANTPVDPAPQPAMAPPAAPKKKRGFLRMLMWLLLIAAAAGGVYYWQNQQVSDLNKKLADANSQISRLNTQNYNYQQQIAAASQKDQSDVLTVKEWGVKVPLTTSTANLAYTMTTLNGKQNAQAAFRTKQLDTMFPNCTTNSVVLVRGQASDTFSGTGTSVKTFKQQYDVLLADKSADWTKTVKPQLIGTYYYIQAPAGAACATKTADVTQEAQIIQAVKDALNKMAAA